jgi:hypothetical protein
MKGAFLTISAKILLLGFFFIVLLCFLSFCKIKHYAVYAVAKAGRRRPIVEHMTQMGLATATLYLCSFHTMCIIRGIDDAALADGVVKTGPAATTFKLGITFKQCIATSGTVISSYFLEAFKLTCIRSFCTFLTGNIKDIGRKNFHSSSVIATLLVSEVE